MSSLYVMKGKNGLYELRQLRFSKMFEAGREHPHDVCAVAHSVEQMHEMVDKMFDKIDYSRVEGESK